MADYPTFSELFRVGRDEHLARNPLVSREVLDQEGTEANALIAAAAAVGDECLGQLASVESGLYYATARGDALRRLAWTRDQQLPKLASPGTVTLAFSLPTASVSAFTIPAGTGVLTKTKARWVTRSALVLPAGSSGPAYVSATSELAGSDQQVGPGAVNALADVVEGAPAGLAVTNPYASFGAGNDEAEDAFAARMQRYYVARRRGTLAAIATVAQEYPGVVTATAFSVEDEDGEARLVELVVADELVEGLVDATTLPPSYAAQSAAFGSALYEYLRDVRAGGIGLVITVGSVQITPVALGLRYAAGAVPEKVAAAARARTIAYVNALAPGQSYSSTALEAELSAITGLAFPAGTVLSPIGTIAVGPTTVLRTTSASVTLGGS